MELDSTLCGDLNGWEGNLQKGIYVHVWASQVALVVKSLACQCRRPKRQVWSLGWKDPLEKEMATHSSILACEIPWTEEPGRLWFMGSKRVGHDLVTKQQQ